MFGKSSKHFFKLIITVIFIIFGSMLLGHIIVNEMIKDAYTKLHVNIAAISMFLVSFLVGMIAWQGLGVLRILMWVIVQILTLGNSKMDAPTQIQMPPDRWRLITYAALTCGVYGLLIGLFNPELKFWITILDFSIVGGCWGVFLSILGRFGFLPFVDTGL